MEAQAFSSREPGTLQKQHHASCGKYRRKLLSSFTIRAAWDMHPVDILLPPDMACGVTSKACLVSRWLVLHGKPRHGRHAWPPPRSCIPYPSPPAGMNCILIRGCFVLDRSCSLFLL